MRRKLALTRSEAFRVLELNPTSSNQEVKARFRELSLKYHPDRNPSPEALRKYQWLALAKDILLGKQKPGKPELHTYNEKYKGKENFKEKPKESFDIKKWVVLMSKRVSGKPVKRSGHLNTFAIRLSENVGIYLVFSKDLTRMTSNLVSLKEGPTSWDPLTVPETIEGRSQWNRRIYRLVDLYERKASDFEPTEKQDLTKLISTIIRFEEDPKYILILKALKKPPVTEYKQFIKDNLKLLKDLYVLRENLMKKSRSATKVKAISTYISRIFRGKPLTPIQINNLKKMKQGPSSQKQRQKKHPRQVKINKNQLRDLLRYLKPFSKPQVKDLSRVEKILLKDNPVKEALTQSAKITHFQKAVRRAKAALFLHTSAPESLRELVAQVFLNRALELGFKL